MQLLIAGQFVLETPSVHKKESLPQDMTTETSKFLIWEKIKLFLSKIWRMEFAVLNLTDKTLRWTSWLPPVLRDSFMCLIWRPDILWVDSLTWVRAQATLHYGVHDTVLLTEISLAWCVEMVMLLSISTFILGKEWSWIRKKELRAWLGMSGFCVSNEWVISLWFPLTGIRKSRVLLFVWVLIRKLECWLLQGSTSSN